MRINNLFNSFIILAALSISACDGVDDEPRERKLAGDLEDGDIHDLSAADDEITRDDITAKPTPEDGSPDLPELHVVDENDPAAGPPGTYCCADCGGDGWSGYWNLGTADNCNSRAWEFCINNFYANLINAEWTQC